MTNATDSKIKFSRAFAGRYTAEAMAEMDGDERRVYITIQHMPEWSIDQWSVLVGTERDRDNVMATSDVQAPTYRDAKAEAEAMIRSGFQRLDFGGWSTK